MFYLTSVDQVWKVNPADGSYERIEEVSEEEKSGIMTVILILTVIGCLMERLPEFMKSMKKRKRFRVCGIKMVTVV